EPPRVRGALGDHTRARASRPEGDASRADESRRRDRPARRRRTRCADRDAGARGSRDPDGRPLRPVDERPGAGTGRRSRGGGVTLFWKNGSRDTLTLSCRVVDPTEGSDEVLTLTSE